jgi:hypothetical protein
MSIRRDTLDKIVATYFAAVTAEPFTYRGKQYTPMTLHVSPLLLRGFTCPSECGGCCPRFTLDWLPSEPRPDGVRRRSVMLNGNSIPVYTIIQGAEPDRHYCNYLLEPSGRCGIHGKHPFSCDFELIRISMHSGNTARLNTRLFGRGWSYLRVDGGTGAKCSITPATEDTATDAIRKLERLMQWSDHFKLKTRIPTIINWAKSHPTTALTLAAPSDQVGLMY